MPLAFGGRNARSSHPPTPFLFLSLSPPCFLSISSFVCHVKRPLQGWLRNKQVPHPHIHARLRQDVATHSLNLSLAWHHYPPHPPWVCTRLHRRAHHLELLEAPHIQELGVDIRPDAWRKIGQGMEDERVPCRCEFGVHKGCRRTRLGRHTGRHLSAASERQQLHNTSNRHESWSCGPLSSAILPL